MFRARWILPVAQDCECEPDESRNQQTKTGIRKEYGTHQMIELEGDARDEQCGAEQGKSKGKAMLHACER